MDLLIDFGVGALVIVLCIGTIIWLLTKDSPEKRAAREKQAAYEKWYAAQPPEVQHQIDREEDFRFGLGLWLLTRPRK